MRMCQHCGAGVPNYAGFCGECGKLVTIDRPDVQERTLWLSHSTPPPEQAPITIITPPEDREEQTDLALTEARETQTDLALTHEDGEIHEDLIPDIVEEEKIHENSIVEEETCENPIPDIVEEETRENPIPDIVEEDEEERPSSALLDLNLPLLANAVAEHPTLDVPMVQNTPRLVSAPSVPQTPPIENRQLPHAGHLITSPLVLPGPERVFSNPLPPDPQHFQEAGRPPQVFNKPQSKQPAGCMVWLLAAIIVPLIILVSIIGIGLTFLAPTLTLAGNTIVATGSVLHLYGGHFIPGDRVTCILDGNTPLSYSNLSHPTVRADIAAEALLTAQQNSMAQETKETNNTTEASSTITVGSNGTFAATFVVGQDWQVGQHTIRATEGFSPRSATTTFTVTGNGQALSTATPTVTATATAKTTATPSPTPTIGGLSAITPNIIAFGPLSTSYTQTASDQVLLSTTGTAAVDWTATWDKTQAPWLQLNTQSGQIQEPATQTLVINAVVGNLKAGTYNTTILFSSNGQNGQNLSLPVSLTIQNGCIKTSSGTLTFTGVTGGTNPAAQTIMLNNCGALGSWTETTTGGSWLLVTPTGGNLNTGASQSVIVSVNLATIKTGTYQGQIAFRNGTAHISVMVTLTVKAAPLPLLASNATSFRLQQCTFVITVYKCSIIVLHSNATAQSNLNWTATSSNAAFVVTPESGTLQPGQTAALVIDAPRVACEGSVALGTVTFSGPANSITVTVEC